MTEERISELEDINGNYPREEQRKQFFLSFRKIKTEWSVTYIQRFSMHVIGLSEGEEESETEQYLKVHCPKFSTPDVKQKDAK